MDEAAAVEKVQPLRQHARGRAYTRYLSRLGITDIADGELLSNGHAAIHAELSFDNGDNCRLPSPADRYRPGYLELLAVHQDLVRDCRCLPKARTVGQSFERLTGERFRQANNSGLSARSGDLRNS